MGEKLFTSSFLLYISVLPDIKYNNSSNYQNKQGTDNRDHYHNDYTCKIHVCKFTMKPSLFVQHVKELKKNRVTHLPLELPLPNSLLRKSVSEYLMKHPVFNALPSDQGKQPNTDSEAFSKHCLQEVSFKLLQQSLKT